MIARRTTHEQHHNDAQLLDVLDTFDLPDDIFGTDYTNDESETTQ